MVNIINNIMEGVDKSGGANDDFVSRSISKSGNFLPDPFVKAFVRFNSAR